jgi:phosphatidylserine/phosphatidylglycerophosphate/cardiolipin synthase-like enzyme
VKTHFGIGKTLVLIVVCICIVFLTGCAAITSAGSTTPGNQTTTGELAYYFPRDGQHPDQALISVINSSKSTLDIAIYSLTLKGIVSAIASAEKRGVTVRIITDKTEAAGASQHKALLSLKSDGIPIKFNTHSGLMHMKVTVADNNVVTTGSYNYSAQATNENDEVLVVISDPKVAQDFDKQFVRMWNDTADFANYNAS